MGSDNKSIVSNKKNLCLTIIKKTYKDILHYRNNNTKYQGLSGEGILEENNV